MLRVGMDTRTPDIKLQPKTPSYLFLIGHLLLHPVDDHIFLSHVFAVALKNHLNL